MQKQTPEDTTAALTTEHHQAGRRAEAEALCRQVLKQEPGHAGALHLLAVMAHAQKRVAPAAKLARMAITSAADVPGYHNTLGIILGDLRQWDDCLAAFSEAIRLDPANYEAHRNLGVALTKAGRQDEAAVPLRQAAELRPDDPAAWSLLASLHYGLLNLRAAVDCRRRALALRPDDVPAHSDLLVTLHYSPEYSAEELLAEHAAWAGRHEEPVLARFPERPFEIDRGSGRPLRVGYLSGDFREHPRARFFFPLLAAHDRTRVTVFCYSDVPRPDRQTKRLAAKADVWRDIAAMDDDAAAAVVRADRIDVLVDMCGHLDNRRLLVFARRPAPVRVSFVAYPNTTGMRSIGYRFTDAWLDPFEASHPPSPGVPGEGERHSNGGGERSIPTAAERLIRLPGCGRAYDAGDDPVPAVNELPALSAGRVTFAVFNRLIKVTPAMACLWSRIVRSIPSARLLVLDSTGGGEASCRAALERLGVRGIDLDIRCRVMRGDYLTRYHEADIALDTHPYAGVTTTCDATWMGVPTVTLAGDTQVSRSGVSLLSAVGLPGLIARTPEEYVKIAVGLACDLPRLAALRAGMRVRMRQSPLCDGPRLAREVEAAYREMWREWCGGGR